MVYEEIEMTYSQELNADLIPATLADYPMIQNMARFYVYDISRDCGLHYPGWEIPADGLYECRDFKEYFDDPINKVFLVKVGDEVAGFVMIDKIEILPDIDFNMGQFFILAKFQRTGLASRVAHQVFNTFQGAWSVGVIPENKRALNFWRKCIREYTNGVYAEKLYTKEDLITAEHPDPFPNVIMTFDSRRR
jgi:predicted acetyltransferase